MASEGSKEEKERNTLPFSTAGGAFATLWWGYVDGEVRAVGELDPLRPMWYRVWMLGGCKDLLLRLQERPADPPADMLDQMWILHNALLEAFLAVHLRALGDFLADKTGPLNTDLVAEGFVRDVKKWKAHDVTKRWRRDWRKLHERISKWAAHLTPVWRRSPKKAEWHVEELSRSVGGVLEVFLDHVRDEALPPGARPGVVELVQRLTQRGT